MVLLGWTQPVSAAENKDKSVVGNGTNMSDSAVTSVESANDDEIGIVSAVKKRKLPDDSDSINAADEVRNGKQLQVIDDEDDLVMLDGNLDSFKRKRMS